VDAIAEEEAAVLEGEGRLLLLAGLAVQIS